MSRPWPKPACHAIVFDTLFASQCIMNKKMWKEIEGPFTKRLADTTREAGAMVMVHNCGNGVYSDVQIEEMARRGDFLCLHA